jgi:hypothetical protein
MTTEQTAQQLELAAQIIRTGHPFEVRHDSSDRWHASLGVNPAQAVLQDWHLRPVLATPPDNRPLHNPDNLTAEQVGVGYRLTLKGEPTNLHVELQEYWSRGEWQESGEVYTTAFGAHQNARYTYRLPLSVPWPPAPVDPYAELKAAHAAGKVIQGLIRGHWIDSPHPTWKYPVDTYREKPEEPIACAVPQITEEQRKRGYEQYGFGPAITIAEPPPFQLPPPPPGMSWHRMDGWRAEDLPNGYRPHVEGETDADGDELRMFDYTWWRLSACTLGSTKTNNHRRTVRPLTFEHAGKTWTYRRPGDPMPCDGGSLIWVLYGDGTPSLNSYCANDYVWGRVIGWRYAELQTKTVPLGPEDVPPGSVFRGAGEAKDPDNKDWCLLTSCSRTGIRYWRQSDSDPEPISWLTLKTNGAQINRSLSLTGKWNPDAWEPCHKKYDC